MVDSKKAQKIARFIKTEGWQVNDVAKYFNVSPATVRKSVALANLNNWWADVIQIA